jgi:hypothetical protein
MPVFTVSGLTFGIMICRDSNFRARESHGVSRGDGVFVPTNNGLPLAKACPDIVVEARRVTSREPPRIVASR